jgi:hypothetical protein
VLSFGTLGAHLLSFNYPCQIHDIVKSLLLSLRHLLSAGAEARPYAEFFGKVIDELGAPELVQDLVQGAGSGQSARFPSVCDKWLHMLYPDIRLPQPFSYFKSPVLCRT